MTPQEYGSLNALLREPTAISVHQLVQGARIGLYVVAQLARRHDIAVQLQPNITGGTQALVVLPKALLATSPAAGSVPAGAQAPAAGSGPAVAPGSGPAVRRPGAAAVADGSVDSGFAPATARPASVPGGALPAPRRAGDGQAVAVSTGIRSAPSAAQAPLAHVPEHPGPRPTPHASAPRNNPQTQVGAPEQADAARPPLPRRRPQQHLAPHLAEQASARPDDRVSDRGLTPGLMADFRQGMARGHEQPTPEDHSDEHAPIQEGR